MEKALMVDTDMELPDQAMIHTTVKAVKETRLQAKTEVLVMMDTIEHNEFKKWRLQHHDSEAGHYDLINDFLEFRREKHLSGITASGSKP